MTTNMRNEWDEAKIAAIAESFQDKPGALLPILHKVQDTIGFIPAGAVPIIAAALNLSRAEVHGVISFYHDFHSAPHGRIVVRLCRAESCQATGAGKLAQYLKQRLKIDFGETRDDGLFTLESVYCFGNCACSPALTVNDELHGRISVERLDILLGRLEDANR